MVVVMATMTWKTETNYKIICWVVTHKLLLLNSRNCFFRMLAPQRTRRRFWVSGAVRTLVLAARVDSGGVLDGKTRLWHFVSIWFQVWLDSWRKKAIAESSPWSRTQCHAVTPTVRVRKVWELGCRKWPSLAIGPLLWFFCLESFFTFVFNVGKKNDSSFYVTYFLCFYLTYGKMTKLRYGSHARLWSWQMSQFVSWSRFDGDPKNAQNSNFVFFV